MQQKKQYNQTLKPPGEPYCLVTLCLCNEDTCRKTPLFSTIAGKSQNLSDVRSEACAVDWFLYYAGCSLLMNLQEDERFICVWLICL